MDALDALTSRASPLKLAEPAPEGDVLDRILRAAVNAPDHGRLRPWRFLLVRGAARERLGEVLAEALRRREADATEPMLEKERAKPLRAPLIVVVAAKVQPDHPKIPPVEQVLAAGAAAENMLIAAHALGFGGMWRTGAPAYDETVKAALGLASSDVIVGFLYLGTTAAMPPLRKVPEVGDFVEEWTEPRLNQERP